MLSRYEILLENKCLIYLFIHLFIYLFIHLYNISRGLRIKMPVYHATLMKYNITT